MHAELDTAPPDLESRVADGDHAALKLWLRLLACTTRIEGVVRHRLRAEFGTTLPRFDLLAQLERHPEGLTMGELSARMMVTGGNVTGIVDQLEAEGLVRRVPHPGDRRAWSVRFTPAGRRQFRRMAATHETWIAELLGGWSADEMQRMQALLGTLKQHLAGVDAPRVEAAHEGEERMIDPHLREGNRKSVSGYAARHFGWRVEGRVGVVTLNRPERKNPLTFDSYAELRDLFRTLAYADDVRAVVLQGEGGNFCSGGDVHDIIGPLVAMKMPDLLAFTRMTGDLVKAMRGCGQPIVAAVDGVCAGAGAILAMASDLRVGTARSKVAFLFTRVGLAGCDMGACAMLPRIVGQGRASELLYTGRALPGDEALAWGFYNRLAEPEAVQRAAFDWATELAAGPGFGHAMTKRMLHQEWAMGIDEAIESEAQAQAICMMTQDFHRAYHAFVAKQKPSFGGD